MMAWVGKRSIWAVVITAAGKVGRKSGRAESVSNLLLIESGS